MDGWVRVASVSRRRASSAPAFQRAAWRSSGASAGAQQGVAADRRLAALPRRRAVPVDGEVA
eukprot:6707056-Pyramimonas_sp.AAC.1